MIPPRWYRYLWWWAVYDRHVPPWRNGVERRRPQFEEWLNA